MPFRRRRRAPFKRGAMRTRRRRFPRRFARRRNARIGGFLGIELKFYDTSLNSSAIQATTDASLGEQNPSATIALNTVTQGDGESQRDGRKITMRSITIDGTITMAGQSGQSASDAPIPVMIALVLDTQTNGALLNSEDVFKNVGGFAAVNASLMRNLQFIKRFKVLAIRKMSFDSPRMTNDTGATGGVITGGLIKRFHIFVNLKNRQTIYNGTTETIANITDNSLTMLAWTTSETSAPLINYSARLRFVG